MEKTTLKKITSLLLLPLFLVSISFLAKPAAGSIIDTQRIIRQTPPRPPSPPIKPEPPPPPCPGCPKPTPVPTPGPTPSPSPSPTPPPEGGPTSPPSGAEGGVGGPWGCGASTPEAPKLLSVVKSGSQASLSWGAVSGITHYALSYGLSAGNYIYGVANTGNTTSFTVSELNPGSNYCFAVRAVNDCAPSSLSNEVCTGAVLGVGQVLGLSYTGNGSSFVETLFLLGSLCLLLSLKSLLAEKRLI